jgi:hypothetical protein
VLLGLAALAVLPAGIAVSDRSESVSLLQAAFAVPLAALLGVAALAVGGHARRRVQLTIGRVGGDGVARAGRLLGGLALYLSVTAGLAIGFYALLDLFAR